MKLRLAISLYIWMEQPQSPQTVANGWGLLTMRGFFVLMHKVVPE
jgi:hypothetical protein